MSQEFLDAVEAAEKAEGQAAEAKPEASDDDHLVVDGAHFPSTVAGLCSCMLAVLQALKQAALQSNNAEAAKEILGIQVLLRDQAQKTFPKLKWEKV